MKTLIAIITLTTGIAYGQYIPDPTQDPRYINGDAVTRARIAREYCEEVVRQNDLENLKRRIEKLEEEQEAEAVNAGAVAILEFGILILGSIELVRLAILLPVHSSSGVFFHRSRLVNGLVSVDRIADMMPLLLEGAKRQALL